MVSDANNYNIKSYSVKALQQIRILKLKLKLLISHSQKCHLLFQLLQALNALHRAQIFDIISKPTTYRAHLKISIGTLLSFSIKWLSIFFIIKNWPTSRASFVYISLFKQTIQIFDNQCEKSFPSSIWCREPNPRPLEHKSSPMTTRPRSRPRLSMFYLHKYPWSFKLRPNWSSFC